MKHNQTQSHVHVCMLVNIFDTFLNRFELKTGKNKCANDADSKKNICSLVKNTPSEVRNTNNLSVVCYKQTHTLLSNFF